MNSINHCTLLGHVTRDPRLRTTSSGKAVCDFGLALNRRWLDINGDSKQETTFVDVTAWNQQAEVITEYCQKGRPVVVESTASRRSVRSSFACAFALPVSPIDIEVGAPPA